jgi:hypothetical protein
VDALVEYTFNIRNYNNTLLFFLLQVRVAIAVSTNCTVPFPTCTLTLFIEVEVEFLLPHTCTNNRWYGVRAQRRLLIHSQHREGVRVKARELLYLRINRRLLHPVPVGGGAVVVSRRRNTLFLFLLYTT